MPSENKIEYYEFFAGGGMARLGLGNRWRCILSNDICPKKAMTYRKNFAPAHELICTDVANIGVDQLPGSPTLAWASFPCQDLSLAGERRGLNGRRSGSFWAFWNLVKTMSEGGRTIPIIVLENVVGTLTSNGGSDFSLLLQACQDLGYEYGAMVIDAIHFLPQSRPRLFIVATQLDKGLCAPFVSCAPVEPWHPRSVLQAFGNLPPTVRSQWLWWHLPPPSQQRKKLDELIDEVPDGVSWDPPEKTKALLKMMSPANLSKVEAAKLLHKRVIGTVYKRTRKNEEGKSVQRAEVRFDQISGCLRTPGGGSSRQTILVVEGESVRSRLLSPREAARLMGVPEGYWLSKNYNEAYHLIGDGLAVPVVSWLEKHLLYPLADLSHKAVKVA